MARCGHQTTETFRICRHLLDDHALDMRLHFTGVGKDCTYLCEACRITPGETVDACAACRDALGEPLGFEGEPQVLEEPSTITAVHRACGFAWPAVVDLQPLLGSDRARFLGVTADTTLHEIDLDAGTARVVGHAGLELAKPMLRVSRDGSLAAVVDEKGVRGSVIDLAERRVILPLVREDYHAEHCTFPIAFVERDRTLLAWSPVWNRLDIVDPRTGESVTGRPLIEHGSDHYLDYFHSGLAVSPDASRIASNGWHWHPYGSVVAWSVDAWLANPYESEDGPSRRSLAGTEYLWDRPLCWIDGNTVVLWGIGDSDRSMLSAVRVVDVDTGKEHGWFPGPTGDLVFDRELFSIEAEALTVWNVARGTRLFRDTATQLRYHPSAKLFVSLATGAITTLRGADARFGERVTDLAARIAREQAWDDLPVLGDALESEGCDDAALLAHCHAPGPHAGRCWVIDRITAHHGAIISPGWIHQRDTRRP
jgi:hypothetical protein